MDLLRFFENIGKLKEVKRTGWVERGVREPETSAEHSFMTAVLCMMLADKSIDRDKAIRMAIIHDFVEAEVGDIISKEYWEEGGSMRRQEQLALERKAMEKIKLLMNRETAEEVSSLWEEFEEARTPEGKFAKSVDRLEATLQAIVYHKHGNYKKSLEGFWDDKKLGFIPDERIKRIASDIIRKI